MFIPETVPIKKFKYEKIKPIGIDIKFLRRGVIGAGVVGYIYFVLASSPSISRG